MKNKILFAFLYLVAFTAVGQAIIYFEQMPTLDVIYSNCRLALFPIVLFVFFIKKVKWNGFFTLLALYFSVILFSSIEHGTNALIPLISLTITTISLIASISIGAKVDFEKAIKMVRDVFNIYILLNFLLILLYPEGIWFDASQANSPDEVGRYFIGGNYNQMGAALICAVISNAVYYYLTKRDKLVLITSILVSITSLAIVGSKTSLIGVALFTIFLMLSPKRKQSSFLLYGFLAFYVFFQIQTVFLLTDLSHNSFINYFLEDVLQKDSTFSFRTNLWFRSAPVFLASPLDGWGFQDIEWYEDNINGVSPHNYIYSVLLKGGLILLCVLILIIFYLIVKEKKGRCVYTSVALAGFFILLFMMIMEVYNIIYIVYIIFLSYLVSCHSLETKLFIKKAQKRKLSNQLSS